MDTRQQFYSRYVSTFKDENIGLTKTDLDHYYRWCNERYFPFLSRLPKTANVLELGCGHGRILHYLHQKGFSNVRGIDVSDEQVTLTKKEGLNAECADVFEYLSQVLIPLDCIIGIDFVEHFSKEELVRLCSLMHSALKPGGMILLQTVNGEGLFPRQIIYGDLTHMTILTPGSMTQLLRSTGFSDIQFAESAPITHGIVGGIRIILWSMVKFGANILRIIESGKRQKVWTENFITVARK